MTTQAQSRIWDAIVMYKDHTDYEGGCYMQNLWLAEYLPDRAPIGLNRDIEYARFRGSKELNRLFYVIAFASTGRNFWQQAPSDRVQARLDEFFAEYDSEDEA